MLPIPDRIIGSKQLFIPLAYIGVTVTLCYYFLIAFAHTQRLDLEGSNHHSLITEKRQLDPGIASQSDDSQGLEQVINLSFHEDAGRRRTRNEITGSYPDAEDEPKQYGSWRSEPSQVWHGHQNSPDWIDMESPVYFPWPNDAECEGFPVQFAKKNTYKPRALVSYPGSGNSWLRYLLEGSTGVFTGSVFGDKALFRAGLLGELRTPNDGSTIVQKTHHNTVSSVSASPRIQQAYAKLTELMFGYRGILLVRNPYDAIRSYWNFMNTRDHKGHAVLNQSSLSKWKLFVEDGSKRWANLIESWVDNSVDFLIVQYEELKMDPGTQLIRILKYLRQSVDEKRLRCVLRHVEGPFHRQHSPNQEQLDSPSFTQNNSHLDLIVQENIEHVNRLFALHDIPIRLNYTLH